MSNNNGYLAPNPASAGATPALSPSSSAGASPAYTDIQSPKLVGADPLTLGESAKSDNLPECWGHRGVGLPAPLPPGPEHHTSSYALALHSPSLLRKGSTDRGSPSPPTRLCTITGFCGLP